MCGIFGFTVKAVAWSADQARAMTDDLFRLSETRGREAAGLAVRAGDRVLVLKSPLSASNFIRQASYASFWREAGEAWQQAARENAPAAVIGHSRLVTNGVAAIMGNNQPVVKNGWVCVHNGIVVNVDELWKHFPPGVREYGVDTEILPTLFSDALQKGADSVEALRAVFKLIRGGTTLALMSPNAPDVLLGTNTGSLYYAVSPSSAFRVFVSERLILERFFSKRRGEKGMSEEDIRHARAGEGWLWSLQETQEFRIDLKDGGQRAEHVMVKAGMATVAAGVSRSHRRETTKRGEEAESFQQGREKANGSLTGRIEDWTQRDEEARRQIRRCRRCVLPATVPFIVFDEEGVCQFCRQYRPKTYHGREALTELCDRYRSRDGRPDCLVLVSGGRDSSYGLHYMATEMKMTCLAYTYDWGMVEDLARRNISRLCGDLGVEHLMVSADIRRKRRYIRQNILAWLRRPHLGMIPLFTAGDKQFFYHARRLAWDYHIPLIVYCRNDFEKTGFKTGFAGVFESGSGTYDLSLLSKMRLTAFYAAQVFTNPGYWNPSLADNVGAYFSSYWLAHDFCYLYDFIPWDEHEITATLRACYQWESASDTSVTWRIGDGSSAFYNYIYRTVAGFTEFDTFRSHQVRAGLMSREQALRQVEADNQPRWEAMQEYARRVGFDLEDALHVIHSMPKLYPTE